MPLLSLLLLAQAAAAPMAPGMKMPEPVCVRAGDLPAAFAGWNAAPSAALAIGTPYIATGKDAPATKPGREGKAASATFTIKQAGVYQVGLASGAWVDVMSGGKPLASVSHGHGPACTGLRKIVDFQLSPGSYTVQLAGMKADTIKLMIVPKPKA